ncbi:MAG: c-type cytochrome domain-containing protein, partial [Cyclobacteriaceae bacterium]
IRTITSIPDAILYSDVIQPIFEGRCYDCHSSRKQKGDLRLDKEELIVKGGKNGAVISDGPVDSSRLYKRLTLPLEHEDHMPPNEKPQLSSSEIALIQYWIEGKAEFEKPLGQFTNHEKITSIIEGLKEAPAQAWIPSQPVEAAGEKGLRKLVDLGIHPMPLAEENNYLMVTFTGSRQVTDEQINSLLGIKDQLVWLNLNNTQVTDQQMEAVAKLASLRVLYLNNTGITDNGVAMLPSLSNLRWLNLVGTHVTDQSIPSFLKMKDLTDLFLYQTALTETGIGQLVDGLEHVKIDTGNYMLEQLPTDTIVFKKTSESE